MFRDGAGRGLLRQFLVGQIMPTGTGVSPSDITGQFGGGIGELAKAQQVSAANSGLSGLAGKVGQLAGGNPQFSGWNAGALMNQANQQFNPFAEQPRKKSPWSDFPSFMSGRYGGGY